MSIKMNAGEGENSYAKNSRYQSMVQEMMQPLVEAAAADLISRRLGCTVGIADLGCSSGPNALGLAAVALNAVRALGISPEFQVFLNDLPANDFNSVFKLLPAFLDEQQQLGSGAGRVFVLGAPGSFHTQLFPAATIHLALSTNSLHWISKVPEEVAQGGELALANKNNIGVGRTSPPAVVEAYANQFKKDFQCFLQCRAREIVPGGWLLISLVARAHEDPNEYDSSVWNQAYDVLRDMASRGIISEEKLHSFEIPFYQAWEGEAKGVIEEEGSFDIHHLSLVKLPDHIMADPSKSARMVRATCETLLVSHFGPEMMEGYMEACTRHFSDQQRVRGKTVVAPPSLCISLRRKD